MAESIVKRLSFLTTVDNTNACACRAADGALRPDEPGPLRPRTLSWRRARG